jgi:hypothetical protein
MRPPSFWNFCGSRRKLDDLLQVLLGFVHARHVIEGHAAMTLGQKLRLGLAEAHGSPAARLHLAHEEDPHGNEEQHGEPGHEHAEQRRHVVLGRLGGDLHALLVQLVDQVGIVRRIGLEIAAVSKVSGDLIAGDGHILDVAALNLGKQLRKADLIAADMHARALEQVEQSNEQQEDEDPDGEVTEIRVHELT